MVLVPAKSSTKRWLAAMYGVSLAGPWAGIFVLLFNGITQTSKFYGMLFMMLSALTIGVLTLKSIQFFWENDKRLFLFMVIGIVICLISYLAGIFYFISFK